MKKGFEIKNNDRLKKLNNSIENAKSQPEILKLCAVLFDELSESMASCKHEYDILGGITCQKCGYIDIGFNRIWKSSIIANALEHLTFRESQNKSKIENLDNLIKSMKKYKGYNVPNVGEFVSGKVTAKDIQIDYCCAVVFMGIEKFIDINDKCLFSHRNLTKQWHEARIKDKLNEVNE